MKVFLSSVVRTLTKEVDASKQIAAMKLEILRHLKYPGDGNDCELVLVSSGGSLRDEDSCDVLRDNDFLVLCKTYKTNMLAICFVHADMHYTACTHFL